MIPLEMARKILGEGLKRGGELSEIYLEERETFNLDLDDGKIQRAVRGNDRGGGVRVFYDDTAAYAYTDDVRENTLLEAARAASAASKSSLEPQVVVDLTKRENPVDVEVKKPFSEMDERNKVDLLHQMDRIARKQSPYVSSVNVSMTEVHRGVWVFNSEGVWAEDDRNFLEIEIAVTAKKNGVLQRSYSGVGAQSGLELIETQSPLVLAEGIAQSAVRMLDARPAPAGEMTVVIINGWGGVLFHEACGHALEADFVTKGTSIYSGLVGEKVASPLVTAIDDGTLPNRRGSLRFDDDGTPSSRTVLIENGILKDYIWDLKEARRAGRQSTGNGRRETFRHMPMPRMTNTFIDVGTHDPEEIIRSVKRGFYAKQIGGGQADFARGDFVFTVIEGYLIEDGRITAPVRGATLMGNGPQVLKQIDMVGNDFALDTGRGRCGKGQWVRVSVGQPTVRVPTLMVGGTDREISGQIGA
jgi:TldD protein